MHHPGSDPIKSTTLFSKESLNRLGLWTFSFLLTVSSFYRGEAVNFSTDVIPILERHCYECHNENKSKASLRLDITDGWSLGGDSGEPLIRAGQPGSSLLIQRITHSDPSERMPPEGEGLSSNEIETIQGWIRDGASLPKGGASENSFYQTDHWAFQPIQRPDVPSASSKSTQHPIDAFIAARQEDMELSFSEEADRFSLLRRLSLLMKGIPPTPEELLRFQTDRDPFAWDRWVDMTLSHPQYGEKWARHWLDVVRYADSNGFETNRERKTAWHYRDYVINAFNTDKPYDRFVHEQLAGDFFGEEAATGFLVAGPVDIVKSPDISLTLMQRQNELDDMINTTSTAFLGLTVGCARCHTHKFDPIHQKEYYGLQAIFAGVEHGERPLQKNLPADQKRKIEELQSQLADLEREINRWKEKSTTSVKTVQAGTRPPVNARLNEETFEPVDAQAVRFTVLASTSGEPCMDELEIYDLMDLNVALSSLGTTASASGTLPGYAIHQLKHIHDGKHGNQHSWISNSAGSGWVQIDFPSTRTIQKIIWSRDRNEEFTDRLPTRYFIEAKTPASDWIRIADSENRMPHNGQPDPNAFLSLLSKEDRDQAESLLRQHEELKSNIQRVSRTEMIWAGNFNQPEPTHRLYRGDPMQKREAVPPGTLQVIRPVSMASNEPEQTRRVKLAEWITAHDNPLTARVMVNRIWHYVFGRGIVGTPSDFGANGLTPTHPELLDWLADEFIRSGWSVKHIQRLILTSHTFRQSSQPNATGLAKDAEGLYLWRFTPRRLSAEPIRDSILATSGVLDPRMGGPGFYLLDVQVENVMHYFPKETFGPPEFRRMVYMSRIRQEQDAIFGAFDCPDGNQVIPNRSRSNTPIQALNLFNSPFIQQQSNILAERLRAACGEEMNDQISQAFLLLHAKMPDEIEIQMSKDLIQSEGLESFCRALYNSSRFLFVF
jgi:hypothetical protein